MATAEVTASLTPKAQKRSVAAAFNTVSSSKKKAKYSGKDSQSSKNVASFSKSKYPAKKLNPKRGKN